MIRVGLVGCGFIAQYHAVAYRACERGALVAVCDVVPAKAESFVELHGARAYPDLGAMLASEALDLIDVVTPQEHHLEPVLQAIEAGKHVFVEKPLALDLGEAERMLDAARARGVRLAVDFNRRFGGGYRLAKEYQQAGRLGDFSYVLLKISSAADSVPSDPYFMAYDLGIHAADLARLFGGEVARVSAQMSSPRPTAYRNLAISLEFASGGVGTILISQDGTRLHPIEHAEIGGTAGQAQVHNVVSGFDFFPHDSDLATRWRPQPFGGREHLLQFYPTTIVAHVEALLEALEAGREPPVSGEDGVAALRIVLAAIQSFETGKTVEPASLTAARS